MNTMIYDVSEIMHVILEDRRMSSEDLGEVIKFLYIEGMRVYRTTHDFPNISFYGYDIRDVYENVPISKDEVDIIDEVYPIVAYKIQYYIELMIDAFKNYHPNSHRGLDVKEIHHIGHSLYIEV